jgi:phosphoglycolate phosphatase
MSSGRTKLAVFDCDGTLVDSQHIIVACMEDAFNGEGLTSPSAAQIRRIIGLQLEECFCQLVPAESDARRGRLAEAYKESFFARRQRPDHHEPLFDGALDALRAVENAGWLLGVATGKAKRGLLAVLERHGLENRFVTLQTADFGPGKPHPAMLERAMDEAGAAAADTVMIGDTVYDMQMARSAGTRAIGVAWGYHPVPELHEAGAHSVAETFHHLPDVIAHLSRSA